MVFVFRLKSYEYPRKHCIDLVIDRTKMGVKHTKAGRGDKFPLEENLILVPPYATPSFDCYVVTSVQTKDKVMQPTAFVLQVSNAYFSSNYFKIDFSLPVCFSKST